MSHKAGPRRIVAEVTKNWHKIPKTIIGPKNVISMRFEEVISRNRLLGFHLESWNMQSVVIHGGIVETIVAVFVETNP